jgi:hypothetical protein
MQQGIGARTTGPGPAAAGKGWPAGACVLLPRPLGAGGWRAALRRCGGRRSADAAGRRRAAGHWPCFAAGSGAPLQLGTGAGKRKAATAAVAAVARRHRHGSCSHGQKTQLSASVNLLPASLIPRSAVERGRQVERESGGAGSGKAWRWSEGARERGSRGERARHRARIRQRAGRPLSAGSGPGLRRIRPGLRRAHRTGTPGHPGRSEGATPGPDPAENGPAALRQIRPGLRRAHRTPARPGRTFAPRVIAAGWGHRAVAAWRRRRRRQIAGTELGEAWVAASLAGPSVRGIRFGCTGVWAGAEGVAVIRLGRARAGSGPHGPGADWLLRVRATRSAGRRAARPSSGLTSNIKTYIDKICINIKTYIDIDKYASI